MRRTIILSLKKEVRAGRNDTRTGREPSEQEYYQPGTRAEVDVEIDLKTIMVEPGTTFLLCSDGITRHIEDNEIAGILVADTQPGEICERLREICYDRGAEDNLTAIVVRVANAVEAEKELSAAAGAGDGDEVTVASSRCRLKLRSWNPRPKKKATVTIFRLVIRSLSTRSMTSHTLWTRPAEDQQVDLHDLLIVERDRPRAAFDSSSAHG